MLTKAIPHPWPRRGNPLGERRTAGDVIGLETLATLASVLSFSILIRTCLTSSSSTEMPCCIKTWATAFGVV